MMNAPFYIAALCGLAGVAAEFMGVWQYGVALIRQVAFGLAVVTGGFMVGALLTTRFSAWGVAIAVVGLYRLINDMRLAQGRLPVAYARRAGLRTVVVLAVMQALVALGWLLSARGWKLGISTLLFAATSVMFLSAVVMLLSTLRTLRKASLRPAESKLPDMDLPTVSVCIPARNESEDLVPCLTAVIANDYPKLEVLVIDDCSQDKTSEIIKGFAHDGVRFIPGDKPADGWLAKNQAYHTLAEAANGDFNLFMGVDVRLGDRAIRAMVATAVKRHKKMLSILPVRVQDAASVSLVQPLRYWWELALPRRLFNRPPVLSTCWLIDRKTLLKKGGFKAVPNKIVPEAYFAKSLVKEHDAYRFMRSSGLLQVATRKSLPEQRDTALRMRYPQVRRRPELVTLLSLGELGLLLAPFVLAGLGFFAHLGLAWIITLVTVVILTTNNVIITRVTAPSIWLLALINFPFVVLTELVLGNESMLKYEFGEVFWKERNICIPVMQTIPRLPRLEEQSRPSSAHPTAGR